MLDPDLIIVEANDAYLTATMRTRGDLIGRPVFDAFPDNPGDPNSDGVAMWGASLRRVLRDRVIDTMAIQKYDIPNPGGGFDTRYWAPVNAPLFGPDDELLYIVHRTEDVTAYIRAQQESAATEQLFDELRERTAQVETEVFARRRLQEQNETLQAVIDSLDAAVISCDAAGRPVMYNDAARALFGTRLEGAPSGQWRPRLDLYTPDGIMMRDEDLPLTRALQGEPVRDFEMVVRHPDEPQRIFRVHARPVTGQPGLAAVVAMHDVTVHRRAARFKECELEVSNILAKPGPADDILGQAVERIGSMIGWAATEFWTADDISHVLRRNASWADRGHALTNDLPDVLEKGQGLPGRAWQDTESVWVPDLRADSAAAQQSADWGPLRAALAIPIPSGAAFLGVLVCYSDTVQIPDDTRTAILTGIGAHIGEFLERRRAERLTAELDRTRDEYVALVGHELRTPLTSLQSYTGFMLDDLDSPAQERAEMLQVMQRNTESLHTIVAKLLDVAGIRSGHIELRPRPMDLAAVVRAAADGATAGARMTKIDVNAPATAAMEGDPDRLRQVIDELLSNALTWTDEHAAVGINLHVDDLAAVMSVSNTGERVRAGERARLFEHFFRGDATRFRGIPGTGLGLTLARAITEQHGAPSRSVSLMKPSPPSPPPARRPSRFDRPKWWTLTFTTWTRGAAACRDGLARVKTGNRTVVVLWSGPGADRPCVDRGIRRRVDRPAGLAHQQRRRHGDLHAYGHATGRIFARGADGLDPIRRTGSMC